MEGFTQGPQRGGGRRGGCSLSGGGIDAMKIRKEYRRNIVQYCVPTESPKGLCGRAVKKYQIRH